MYDEQHYFYDKILTKSLIVIDNEKIVLMVLQDGINAISSIG